LHDGNSHQRFRLFSYCEDVIRFFLRRILDRTRQRPTDIADDDVQTAMLGVRGVDNPRNKS
jgi:hypothetical protein